MISPDGNLVLCGETVATLDGKKVVTVDATRWAGDSSHLLCNYYFGPPVVHGSAVKEITSPAQDGVAKETTSTIKFSKIGVYAFAPPDRFLSVIDWNIGPTPWDKRLNDELRSTVEIVDRRFPDAQILGHYIVKLPEASRVKAIIFSPTGSKILWDLERDVAPPAQQRHVDDATPRPDAPLVHQSIWISNSDGSNMHEVGFLESAAAGTPKLPRNLAGWIKWVPGERKISFNFAGQYYIRSIEQ